MKEGHETRAFIFDRWWISPKHLYRPRYSVSVNSRAATVDQLLHSAVFFLKPARAYDSRCSYHWERLSFSFELYYDWHRDDRKYILQRRVLAFQIHCCEHCDKLSSPFFQTWYNTCSRSIDHVDCHERRVYPFSAKVGCQLKISLKHPLCGN